MTSTIRWVPESARWLIANGKLAEAQTSLRLCAKINQTEEFAETLTPEVSVSKTPWPLPLLIIHLHSDSLASGETYSGHADDRRF